MNSNAVRRLIVAIPVYNEGESIYRLLGRIRKLELDPVWKRQILLVDDSSNDDTEFWIRKCTREFEAGTVRVVRHSENRGLGGALNTLVDESLTLIGPNDIVVTMDGDDTHPVSLVPTMIKKINKGADFVIASRYCKQSSVEGVGFGRKILSMGARCLYTLRWNVPGIRDYTCLFRATRGSVFSAAFGHKDRPRLKEKGFAATVEMLLSIAAVSSIVLEVPLSLRYRHKLNASKMKIASTILQSFAMTFRRNVQ